MDVAIERFVTGPIETNTYVVHADQAKSCLVIDPSSGCGDVLDFIKKLGVGAEAVCLTHGHFDHMLGIEEITAAFPKASVWVHADEKIVLENAHFNGAVMLAMEFTYKKPTQTLHEGDMTIGEYAFSVLHIPGHSPGGCAFLFGKNCISGDTLFAGSIGRTDFPGCNGELFIRSIRQKLLTLPDETVIWPGHGNRTTIGREKRCNPFLS
jgi:glyoxylase-like metal-dependent hydrolase (beta-lactamase superfamily II)